MPLLDFFNNLRNLDDSILRYIWERVVHIVNKLHCVGIAHRNLILENIIITQELEIKVIDLGFAKDLCGYQGYGFTGTPCGTHGYMAPEIESLQPYQSADVDIFALGFMIFVTKIMTFPWNRAS